MISKILWISGASISLVLGVIHLCYTFFTTKFDPRNKDLIDEMKNTSPRLTNQTTMWKAWIGFNASHSSGAIFIGLINIILPIENFSVLENSFFLSVSTIAASVFYLWLARKYWFSVPFGGILLATGCFILSPVLSFF